jgi:hypothetical protein
MTNKLTWPSVVLVAALGAVACVLAVATTMSAGDIIAVLGILGAVGGGAVAGGALAGGVGARVEQLHAETTAQTTTLNAQTSTLNTVAQRVNGELDARIEAGMHAAADRVLTELRTQGVIR